MTLSDLNKDLDIDQNKLAGEGLLCLVLGILASSSIQKKMRLLLEKGGMFEKIKLGDKQIEDYQLQTVQAGCCGCGNKPAQVFPTKKSPATLRDALISMIRTEINIDKEAFKIESNTKHCVALEAVLGFVDHELLGKQKNVDIAKVARDMCAAVIAADALDDSTFQPGGKVIWTSFTIRLRIMLTRCEVLFSEHKLDAYGLAERIKDFDVLQEVKGRGGLSLSTTSPTFTVSMKK
jgi:hypothetical protein